MNTRLLILFALLQAADIWTTLTVLKQGGRELNPFLAKLFTRYDPLTVMVIVKLAGVWVLWYINVWLMTFVACVLMGYIVNRNYWEIKR